jgi:hypothetical protein
MTENLRRLHEALHSREHPYDEAEMREYVAACRAHAATLPADTEEVSRSEETDLQMLAWSNTCRLPKRVARLYNYRRRLYGPDRAAWPEHLCHQEKVDCVFFPEHRS